MKLLIMFENFYLAFYQNLLEELKKKCEEYKKDIEARN